MKMHALILMLVLMGCSSSSNQHKNAKVRNDEFKAVKPENYNASQDYYRYEKLDPHFSGLSDEVYLKDKNVVSGDLAGSQPMTEILEACYDKNLSKAISLSQKHFVQYSKWPSFWNLMGICYYLNKQERKALLFYNKALELKADYAPALSNIGVIYFNQNQFQKAEVAFSKALEKKKFSKTPRFNLAQLYLNHGLAQEALPYFKSLNANSELDVDILSGVANSYFLLGEYAEAVRVFSKIPEKYMSRPDRGLHYALSLAYAGQRQKAQEVLESINSDARSGYKNYFEQVSKIIRGQE